MGARTELLGKFIRRIFILPFSGESGNKDTLYLVYFLISIITLAYILPTLLFLSPSGTDVYSHMYNTIRMADSNSLSGFYEKSFQEEYLLYDYPFGMWFFGSIIMKVTGMSIQEIAYILPLVLSLVLVFFYYIYARHLLQKKEMAIMATIFLVSMPLMVMNMLQYATGRFISVLLLPIIYLSISKHETNKIPIMLLLVFSLIFTHTGTYMFLLFFIIAYFILSALIWKRFDAMVYFLIVSLLVLYVVAVQLFPYVQPQYIDKGRLVLTITGSISSALRLESIKELGDIFYERIFVANNPTYVVFWASLIFAAGKLSIFIRSKITSTGRIGHLALPFIGNIRNISHGITTAPFWLGPVHILLSAFGIFKLDWRGKCIALSLGLTALFPGALQSDEGTGSLRELYYLFLIVPLSAAAGYYYILPAIKSSNNRFKKVFTSVLFMLLFLSLIFAPVIGSLYYMPTISGTESEKKDLMWLGTVGSPTEGVPDFAYRERINLYANKLTPGIPPGTETKRYMDDLEKTYFSNGSEGYTKDLYSFNIKYIISSERTLKGFIENKNPPSIDSNEQLDEIYSSDNFSIYRYVSPPPNVKGGNSVKTGLRFEDNAPEIQDLGSVYLVENEFYKVKISEASPEIKYIGTKTKNLLGDGGFSDNIKLSWRGAYRDKLVDYNLQDVYYPSISVEDNEIVYKAIVKDENNTENWATLIVRYIFHEKAIQREITVANDRVNSNYDLEMSLSLSTSLFAPVSDFEFNQIEIGEENQRDKKIYPSQDAVLLKDKKFSDVYFNEGDTGLYIKYSDLDPYPYTIWYKGSTIYDYSSISLGSSYNLPPADSAELIQYFSVGDKPTAKNNAASYTSVAPYPYQEAKIPIVLAGFSSDIDTSQDDAQYSTNAYKQLQSRNVIYNEGVTPEHASLQEGVKPVGYVNLYQKDSYKSPGSQNNEIKNVKALGVNGVSFKAFRYNLNSIKALSDNNILFAQSSSVSPPYMEFFREGMRDPKMAYYQGEKTGVVLIPVTSPSSLLLRPEFDADGAFNQWRETIDSVAEDGGMAVFWWNTNDIGNPEYINRAMELVDYSKKKGLSFTTPGTEAAYFRRINNVYTKATGGVDYIILNASNYNAEDVKGVTYRLTLPLLKDSCPYNAVNGRIPRQEIKAGECRLYVSFDLKGEEQKEITVESNITRKQFELDFSNVYEGNATIKVMDGGGAPVANASVYVDARRYESDMKGEIRAQIIRGMHSIMAEKPGFVARGYEIDVKGRVYKLISRLERAPSNRLEIGNKTEPGIGNKTEPGMGNKTI